VPMNLKIPETKKQKKRTKPRKDLPVEVLINMGETVDKTERRIKAFLKKIEQDKGTLRLNRSAEAQEDEEITEEWLSTVDSITGQSTEPSPETEEAVAEVVQENNNEEEENNYQL